MSEWISIEERLPELRKLVLCCGKKGGLFVGRLWSSIKREDGTNFCSWDVPNSRTYRDAVYWMEIPETPVK